MLFPSEKLIELVFDGLIKIEITSNLKNFVKSWKTYGVKSSDVNFFLRKSRYISLLKKLNTVFAGYTKKGNSNIN